MFFDLLAKRQIHDSAEDIEQDIEQTSLLLPGKSDRDAEHNTLVALDSSPSTLLLTRWWLLLLLLCMIIVGLNIEMFLHASMRMLSRVRQSTLPWPWNFDNSEMSYQSDARGYIAVIYSGTLRSFSSTFSSHLINLFAPCPYTVHIFMHASITHDLLDPTSEYVNRSMTPDEIVRFYRGYRNLDNEFVPFANAIKYIELGSESTTSIFIHYRRSLSLIGDRSITATNSMLGALYSLEKAYNASHNHAQLHNITYQWLIRIRFDTILRSNIWSSVFNLSHPAAAVGVGALPLDSTQTVASQGQLWLPDGRSVHELYGMRYASALRADLPTIPQCENWWGGWSDQFFMANHTIFAAYALRGLNLRLLSQLRTISSWRFHPELFVAQTLSMPQMYGALQLARQDIPMCYSILRAKPSKSRADDRADDCSFSTQKYGEECCSNYCDAELKKQASMRSNMTQISLLDRGLVPQHPSWSFSLESKWWPVDQSNQYYSNMLMNDVPSGCINSSWDSSFEPYSAQRLSFMVIDEAQRDAFQARRSCASRLPIVDVPP